MDEARAGPRPSPPWCPRREKLSRKPVPALPDALYLDFSKTGNRTRCERVLRERSNRIVTFTLAECLENRGRFVGPLTETIEAICAEKAWTYPAHDRKLDNFYGRTVEMDLRATALAWELATADYLLGDKLSPATRQFAPRQRPAARAAAVSRHGAGPAPGDLLAAGHP